MIPMNFGGFDKTKLLGKLRQWWTSRAGEDGEPCPEATHMVIIADDYDGIFPRFVRPIEDVRAYVDDVSKNPVQQVIEVYDLTLDLETQLAEQRAFHP